MFILKNAEGKIIHYRKNRSDLEKDKDLAELNGTIEETDLNESDFLYLDGIFWIKDEYPELVAVKKKIDVRKSRQAAFEEKTDPLFFEQLETVSSFDDFLNILKDWKSEKNKIRQKYI